MSKPKGVPKGASEYVRSTQGGRVKRRDEFSWDELKPGDLLYEGDTIRSRGATTLRSNKKDSPLPPNSMTRVGKRKGASTK